MNKKINLTNLIKSIIIIVFLVIIGVYFIHDMKYNDKNKLEPKFSLQSFENNIISLNMEFNSITNFPSKDIEENLHPNFDYKEISVSTIANQNFTAKNTTYHIRILLYDDNTFGSNRNFIITIPNDKPYKGGNYKIN